MAPTYQPISTACPMASHPFCACMAPTTIKTNSLVHSSKMVQQDVGSATTAFTSKQAFGFIGRDFNGRQSRACMLAGKSNDYDAKRIERPSCIIFMCFMVASPHDLKSEMEKKNMWALDHGFAFREKKRRSNKLSERNLHGDLFPSKWKLGDASRHELVVHGMVEEACFVQMALLWSSRIRNTWTIRRNVLQVVVRLYLKACRVALIRTVQARHEWNWIIGWKLIAHADVQSRSSLNK